MKNIALILTLLFVVACDESPEIKSNVGIPTEQGTKDEINKGIKDVKNGQAPKWKIEYSGAHSGTIQGGIMSVVSAGETTAVAGGAMSAGMKGKAPAGFNMQIHHDLKRDGGELSLGDMTLADGTKCVTSNEKGAKQSVAKVLDADRKTFHATLSGELSCGDAKDKTIKYTAIFNKQP